MLYNALLRPLLFTLPAERAHDLTLNQLRLMQQTSAGRMLLRSIVGSVQDAPVQAMGLTFRHPVGLAAGLDKNAEAVRGFFSLGFSHVEVGTLTPRPQSGNPIPRLFRLPLDQAIINRMGFNNRGAEEAARRLSKRDPAWGIVGGNVGKNKDTPNERAEEDYILAIQALAGTVDYYTVNISSPNTPGLRDLQHEVALKSLLESVASENKRLHGIPLAVKIAPDLTQEEVQSMARMAATCGFQGIIATNTTIDRAGLIASPSYVSSIGAGGLSGRPLTHKSTQVIEWVREAVGDSLSVVGVGGVFTAQDVIDKRNAGADLIQVYTGFVYQGPGLIGSIQSAWKND
ncbi:MAG: quinone-dependent dihydroorotate dehydrogenase [Cryomorphaceae bacterium]|jgi:dihydroorotate dehydrogenase